MNKFFVHVIALIALSFIAGCQSTEPVIVVENPWARPAIEGNNSAAYFTITNNTGQLDQLINAESNIAEFTEIHMTSMEDGTMKMQQQSSVDLPEGENIEFKPKGLHIMFINLSQNLNAGDEITVTLHFSNQTPIEISIPVKEQP